MTRKPRPTSRLLSLESLEDRLCLSSLPAGTSTAPPDAAMQAHLSAAYGQLPLSFEVNKGQTDPRVNFLTQGAGYTAFLTPTGAVMELQQGSGGNVVDHEDRRGEPRLPRRRSRQAGRREQLLRRQRPSRSGTPTSPTTPRWRTRVSTAASTWSTTATSSSSSTTSWSSPARAPAPSGWRLAASRGNRSTPRATSSCTPRAETWSSTRRSPTRRRRRPARGGQPVRARPRRPGGLPGRPVRPQQAAGDRPGHEPELLDLPRPQQGHQPDRRYGHRRGRLRRRLHHGLHPVTQIPDHDGAFQTSGAFINTTGSGAFVTKFNAAGSALVYSTFLGGSAPLASPLIPPATPTSPARRRDRLPPRRTPFRPLPAAGRRCLCDQTQCHRLQARLLHLSRRKRATTMPLASRWTARATPT